MAHHVETWNRPVECDSWTIETISFRRFGFLPRFRAVAQGYIEGEVEYHCRITTSPHTMRWVSAKTPEEASEKMREIIRHYIETYTTAQENRRIQTFSKDEVKA